MSIYLQALEAGGELADLELEKTEAVWVEIHLEKSRILLCNIYRPPNSQGSYIDTLGDMLELASNERKEVIVMGDLNCNILSPNSMTSHLMSIMDDHQLTQLISEPTRTTANLHTLIDHCFVSSLLSFSLSGATPMAGSDHMLIYAARSAQKKGKPRPKIVQIRSFKKCDVNSLLDDLQNTPWGTMEVFDVEDKWNYWKTLFLNVINAHAPLVKVRRRHGNHQWIS